MPALPGIDKLESLQSFINKETAAGWRQYSHHRASIMRLIEEKAKGNRLDGACILGAGNCNDINLPRIAELFSVVHLIDIDRTAIDCAISHYEYIRDQLTVHAPCDLTGMARQAVAASSLGSRHAEELMRSAVSSVPDVGVPRETCGLVVSTSVFSQLVATVSLIVNPSTPGFTGLVAALRKSHLDLMISLLAPSAPGIFVGELASSEMCPVLFEAQPHELPRLTRRLVEERNFFTGMNPFALAATTLGNAVRNGLVRDVALHAPWIWQLDPTRCYLTYAVSFRKI
jgi:hypothetical protein